MSDGDALLAAIRAHPRDDTPRLVYADWLDDHDQPDEARYVREMVALARVEDRTTDGYLLRFGQQLGREERFSPAWLAAIRGKVYAEPPRPTPAAPRAERPGVLGSVTVAVEIFDYLTRE